MLMFRPSSSVSSTQLLKLTCRYKLNFQTSVKHYHKNRCLLKRHSFQQLFVGEKKCMGFNRNNDSHLLRTANLDLSRNNSSYQCQTDNTKKSQMTNSQEICKSFINEIINSVLCKSERFQSSKETNCYSILETILLKKCSQFQDKRILSLSIEEYSDSNKCWICKNHKRTDLMHSKTCGMNHSCSTTFVRTLSTKAAVSDKNKCKILFFGTDTFAVEVLKILNNNRLNTENSVIETLDVVSNPGKTSVRKYAVSCNLHVLTWPVQALPRNYDFGVLASFGHLIPAKLITLFPHGILNIHPSLLPRWRGSAPIIHTILNGDKTTGISIMKLRPKQFDIGPLLSQKEISVPYRVTSCQLSDLLAKHGADLLLKCLSDLTSCENNEHEQTKDGVTLAQKLKPNMAYVQWNEQTCLQIDRLYRAVSEMMPLKSHWKDLPVKLLDMVDPDLVKDISSRFDVRFTENAKPGTPFFVKDRQLLLIKCKDNWVGFRSIIIKKKMSAQAFYNGYLSKPHNKGTLFI